MRHQKLLDLTASATTSTSTTSITTTTFWYDQILDSSLQNRLDFDQNFEIEIFAEYIYTINELLVKKNLFQYV